MYKNDGFHARHCWHENWNAAQGLSAPHRQWIRRPLGRRYWLSLWRRWRMCAYPSSFEASFHLKENVLIRQGNHTFLGANSSSSYTQSKDDWAIGYVSGSVSGYIVHDDVSIASLKLKNLTFGVAFNESTDFTGYLICLMRLTERLLKNVFKRQYSLRWSSRLRQVGQLYW